MLPLLRIILVWCLVLSHTANGQNCFGGIESFEKTTVMNFDSSIGATTLLTQPDQALTRDCVNLCKQQSACLSFSLDYASFRCLSYNVNSMGRRDKLTAAPTTNFFEKICFRGVSKTVFDGLCGDRLWAFERVKDSFLDGYMEKEVPNVANKEECEKMCLIESSFVCRSADYDDLLRVCRLSKEDRRSQPQAFRQSPGSNRDYLENQCAAPAPMTCLYETRQNVAVISLDSLQFATTSDDCQMQCDRESTFNCRSYTYLENRCFLSGDDTVSLDFVALPPKLGATYGEKKCVIELCTGGIFTYEKMTGHVLRSSLPTSIPLSSPGTLGNTMACRKFCHEAGLDCPAFSVNYQNMRCDKLDRNSQGRTMDLVKRDGENYFEKICLRGPAATSCQSKAWAFERVLGYELAPSLYERTISFVQSRRDCEELCLEERTFMCRSALYNDDTTECKLSPDDRRRQPSSFFRNSNPRINYLENQCVPVDTSCPYEETSDAYPTYTDVVESEGVTSEEVCEQYCTNSQRFVCRSYAFYSSNGQCFLSGDDQASGASYAVQGRSGIVYFERRCQSASSTVTAPVTVPGGITTPPVIVTSPPGNDSEESQRKETFAATDGGASPLGRLCNGNERLVFEKTTGYEPVGGQLSLLYRGDPQFPGITSECIRRCEQAGDCRAMVEDYQQQDCSIIRDNTLGGIMLELRPSTGKAYFEGFCVPTFLGCSKIWVFERYPDHELLGSQPRDVLRFVTRVECERRCLEERRFPCQSANYDATRRECRLYAEDRTAPHAQMIYNKGVQYLENQCAVDVSICRYSPVERDIGMLYVAKSNRATSSSFQCELDCTREREFNCRSFTYIDQGGLINNICQLSAESRQSGHAAALHFRQRALYAEKDCSRQGRVPTVSTPTVPSRPTTIPTVPLPPSPISVVCSYTQYTYEKTAGYELRFARRERILTRSRLGVVAECQDHCQRRGETCLAFLVIYTPFQTCFLLDNAARGDKTFLVPNSNSVYFEKICLREKTCGKLWSFERVFGYQLATKPEREIVDVKQRVECEDLCLREKVFQCRAATYSAKNRLCRLYAETRRTQPTSFQQAGEDIEYLENQCAPEPSTCQYRDFPDRFFPFIDRLTHAYSLADCQRQCDVERHFTCRAVNFEVVARDCALCSEDLVSSPRGHAALVLRRNSIFSEKGSCEQVTVQCNQQDMLLTLNFDGPFTGRVYAKGNPGQCFVVGTGHSTLQFAISLGTRCGTKLEGSGQYVNEVVVQQHPIIMTDTDRSIRVVCNFEIVDRTVTLGGVFGRDGYGSGLLDVTTRLTPPITSIVTNTAPPPNVAMRIVDRSGRDARVVGLGDELTLRIELREPTSAFALFARNLYARSSNGESLFLIDSTGCPTDPSIFPALQLDYRDRKSLYANFKAFRFPSSGTVNFEVQIRFCQERCDPTHCSNFVESFGRRKRRNEPVGNGYYRIDPITSYASEDSVFGAAKNSENMTSSQEQEWHPEDNLSNRQAVVKSEKTIPVIVPQETVVGERALGQDDNSATFATPSTHSTIHPHEIHNVATHPYHDGDVIPYVATTRTQDESPAARQNPFVLNSLPLSRENTQPRWAPWSRHSDNIGESSSSSVRHQHHPGFVNHGHQGLPPIGIPNPESQKATNPVTEDVIQSAFNVYNSRWPTRHESPDEINTHSQSLPHANVPKIPLHFGQHGRLGEESMRHHSRSWSPYVHQPYHPSGIISEQPPFTSRPFSEAPQQEAINNADYRLTTSSSILSEQNQSGIRSDQSNAADGNKVNDPTNSNAARSHPERYRPHNFQVKPDEFQGSRNGQFVDDSDQQNSQYNQYGSKEPYKLDQVPTPAAVVATTQKSVPEEVPLSLAIVVGEDADQSSPWNNINDLNKPKEETVDENSKNVICTSKSTVVASTIVVSLLHIGLVTSAVFCFRWHKRNIRKKCFEDISPIAVPAGPSATNGSVYYGTPEVSFRNVYGVYESPP